MSLRLEMLQVARLAPKVLEDATAIVADFLRSQWHPDGGFMDRSGHPDLYYTVFGLEGLLALQQPLPVAELHRYVCSFNDPDKLDLVHISCLARCWSALPSNLQRNAPIEGLVNRVEACRTPDGGYETFPAQKNGTLYGSYMASGAYQDLHLPIPQTDRLLDFLHGLRHPGQGFWQSRTLQMSLVPTTAGAACLIRQLEGSPFDPAIGNWILSCFDGQGGFRATPEAPVPDLLSTATALHALSAMKVNIGQWKDLCLDFIDSLWINRGGFYGHWEDSHVDCEYTYYALLSLGHLSL